MSKFLDRFRYFKQKGETFADGHGQQLDTNRDWEEGYRQRWQHDKIVRSTHGVNCTGSCSWKIYVKSGLVTWETQQTDYPRTRPDMPNHEPRGCPRGASYSWYLYSANRLKYPLMRKRLIKLWREAKTLHADPVDAWASIINDPEQAKSYKQARGRGGFVRSSWQEVNELIAAANVFTAKPSVLTVSRASPYSSDVDGFLRLWRALSVPDWRHLSEFLRLVLRFTSRVTDDLGRANRRTRIRRLV